MGKIRVAALGSSQEAEQKRRADARRQTKKSKKSSGNAQDKEKVEGIGLKGGQRVAVVEGTEIRPEYKKLVDEVESKTDGPGLGDAVAKEKKRKQKIRVRSKRYQEKAKLVDRNKYYPLVDAVSLVKQTTTTHFDGTVELHINLNQATLSVKGDKKDFRGSVRLPFSTGRTVKVAIADDELLLKIEKGIIDFQVLVAHPSMMSKLAKFAKLLGPKGLMPNPKNGTVSPDPEKRAKELAGGEVNFKTEPDQPVLHLVIGKVSQPEKELRENVEAYIKAVGKSKILQATLASTMGPGIKMLLS